MKNTIELLREKGYKITPQRRAVIAALFHYKNFPTAQEIWEYVRRLNPDTSLDTIYRSLNLLIDLGIISQVNLRGKDSSVFELVSDKRHHHHLICLNCGKTICLDSCPVTESDLQEAQTHGFTIISHYLEFYGYCLQCRNAGQAACP